jgi:hypothetical protein
MAAVNNNSLIQHDKKLIDDLNCSDIVTFQVLETY